MMAPRKSLYVHAIYVHAVQIDEQGASIEPGVNYKRQPNCSVPPVAFLNHGPRVQIAPIVRSAKSVEKKFTRAS
jgi:hypothetical protein